LPGALHHATSVGHERSGSVTKRGVASWTLHYDPRVPQAPTLSIELVGPPSVEVDGRALDVDTRKAIALLAYLAVTGRPSSREVIAGLLWPDTAPDRARSALRRTLSTLRTALDDRWLESDRDVIALEGKGIVLDLARLRALLQEVRAHEHPSGSTCRRCITRLEEAVALARGSFMEGFALRDSTEFEDWQQLVADDAAREVATALDLLADAQATRGDLPQALATARRRLALQPLHEAAHRQLIRLLAESGDRSGALEQYRECVRALDRELGVRPLEETSALYHAILDGTFAPERGATEAAPVAQGAPEAYPLVGRDAALALLTGLLDDATEDGRLAVVVGEAGIGKSRLGEELLVAAAERGRATVAARAFPHEAALPYGVVAELARAALAARAAEAPAGWWAVEVTRILPELGQTPASLLDSLAAQSRFYEAVAALLVESAAQHGPGVVFVDDLQWADEASLGLLAYLTNRLRGRPVLLTLSWRDDDVRSRHRVQALAETARRSRSARVVSLDRLSRKDVDDLVRAAGRDPGLTPDLHRRSGGLPFFVVEYLDALGVAGSEDLDRAVPGGIRELLTARLGSLGDLAVQVLAAGAVLGRSFTAEEARDASGRADEEVVAAIEELVGYGVLGEGAGGSYEFRHEQMRDLVYEEMTLARRRLLHRRAAEALGSRARGGAQTAVVARHYELGGDEPQAAALYQLAGDRARALYANVEALGHYRAALALGSPNLAQLHAGIGDLETLAGDYAEALASYETAAAHADDVARPDVEHRIGALHLRRGEWELADAALASAIAELRQEDAARALADRSLAAHRRGREEDAEAFAHHALVLAARTDDHRALAQAHNLVGMLREARGDRATAVVELETSLVHARRAHDEAAEVAALNNLALAAARSGDLDRGLELVQEALALCARLGDRHREAALRNNLADLLHLAGRDDDAMAALKEAVAIFAEIGEDGRLEPEIWKLTEW
jgi:DNA-binding SARP family transcriptional activator/tetratricopeptide (TPR) repeat protein